MAGLEWQFDWSLLGRMKLLRWLTVLEPAGLLLFTMETSAAGEYEVALGRCCHCRVQLEQEKTKCWNRRKCYRTASWILVVQEEELLVEHGAEPRPDLLLEKRRCCRPDFQSVELKIFFSQCLTYREEEEIASIARSWAAA
ncbi:hypothetical protein OIU77_018146 [Salix suchowensis]|uniref:Uncharacterized protein n=1 Tax=Salix suchowensis TaxID=1278906 RepID=A0ABQ8ZR73_9ROSI|nr:hypothetical protein OIU77_018146 [Salix suchowensis]